MAVNQAIYYLEKIIRPIAPILQSLASDGATCFLVGGAVRDLLLPVYHPNFSFVGLSQQGVLSSQDLDIEVFGIGLEALAKKLSAFAPTIFVGKQFGVLRMPKYHLDWSVPRKDSCGRKPKVVLDQQLSITQALSRRDLTINALAINLSALQCDGLKIINMPPIIDPFGGLVDLQLGVLRPIAADKFLEDPLRFFRVMQFLARFTFRASEELSMLAKAMSLERSDKQVATFIAKERITAELVKMLTKGQRPSLGFAWLLEIGRLQELFPALFAIWQRGDWEKFCTSLDACAQNLAFPHHCFISKVSIISAPIVIPLACILFWINKPLLQKEFLANLSFNHGEVAEALTLANAAATKAGNTALDLKLQAYKLKNCSLLQLFFLRWALGILSTGQEFTDLCRKAEKLKVLYRPLLALVKGSDFLALGYQQGPIIKILLDRAYYLQLNYPDLSKKDIIKKTIK